MSPGALSIRNHNCCGDDKLNRTAARW